MHMGMTIYLLSNSFKDFTLRFLNLLMTNFSEYFLRMVFHIQCSSINVLGFYLLSLYVFGADSVV